MKRALILALLLAAFAWHRPADAARLTTTFTTPQYEALVAGPDTCGPGTAPEVSQLTCRRCWTGPQASCDSLVNQSPNTPVTMFAAVPTGTYTITVDTHDAAGNWSCPVSVTKYIHGKPGRLTDLGFSPAPDQVLAFLSLLMLEQRSSAYR